MSHFTVVDGFCGEMIRETLTSGFPHLDFRFVRNEVYQTTNNAWSLMLAMEPGGKVSDGLASELAGESIFLLDSDILFDPDVISCLVENLSPNRLGLRTIGDIGEEEMKVAVSTDGWVSDLSKELPVDQAAGESVGL